MATSCWRTPAASTEMEAEGRRLQEAVQAPSEENVQLCDKDESSFSKMGYLQRRLTHLASTSSDLSCRLVQSEEERLKITKEFVEEKIQTNKMRQQYEEEMFELRKKVHDQEGVITVLQTERDNLSRELKSTEACLTVKNKSILDLTEECVTLKRNYFALADAHEEELVQSRELSAELLAMAGAQDALCRQLEEQQESAKASTQDLHGELDRVQALISQMSQNRLKLLDNQDEIKDTLTKMKNSHEEQKKKLEEKVYGIIFPLPVTKPISGCLFQMGVMSKGQQENSVATDVGLKKLSEQNVICCRSEVKKVEEENSKLQLQVKELNDEYRSKLLCHLQDIADYMDGPGQSKGPVKQGKMRMFVDGLLRDVRSSYRLREEQLASAARSYKKRLQGITDVYHVLLTAYRAQREQILAKPESGLEPGPPEAHFSLQSSELGKRERELQQSRSRLEGQLQGVREQVAQKRLGSSEVD
ncbi:LOW QUALITY PROTEIN: coiled-coil domain-containing protein 78 [Xenentodon cancila]